MLASARTYFLKLKRMLLLNDKPLSFKLFVFSAVLILIPMLATGYISYHRSSEVLEREAQQYSLQIIDQVKAHTEHYVRDLEIQTIKIVNHPDMKQFLRMRSMEEIEQSGIRQSIQELLQNAAYSRSDITGISIFLDNLQIIDTSGVNGSEPISEIVNQYWYNSVPQTGEPMLISRYIKVNGQPEPVLSIVRRIFSPYTLEPIGMLITDINFKRFQEIADKVSIGRSGVMFILDVQGHYVYNPNPALLGQNANLENLDKLRGNSGSLITSGKELWTYSHSWFLGWTLVTSRPYEEITQGVSHIGRTIFWTTGIALLIAYVLGILVTSSIIQPIRRLQRFMKRVEIGDFSNQIAIESRDEIGMLSRGFNQMVVRLKELLDEAYFSKLRETQMSLRQKEIELKMLQSQINPHFLYNSLETIRGMALEHDMDHIADMSVSVAKLLRYNLKETAPTVPLRSEISVCELYLRIQKYRFEEKIIYEFDIPEWALVQPIVRFSLQPIVENCVVHGLEPSAETTKITIWAEKAPEPDAYLICISDTGKGIDVASLEKLNFEFSQKDTSSDDSRIGILNVHRRIQHICGDVYGLRLQSNEGGGTLVIVRLPLY